MNMLAVPQGGMYSGVTLRKRLVY